MSKAQPRSQFSGFISDDQPVEIEPPSPRKSIKIAKSKDPTYMKASVYLRKSTHRALWEHLVRDNRELSDLIEDLAQKWLASKV